MPYLVDGNNLIGFLAGKGRPSSEEKHALLRRIAARLRTVRSRVLVVFDGPAPSGRPAVSLGPLAIRYSGVRSADDVIVALVVDACAPRDQHVVTDDRELRVRVREAGAQTVSSADFWSRFEGSDGPADGAGPVDVREWMEFFSDDQNRME